MDRTLSPPLEDYLRAIYDVETKQKVARPKDISRAQGVASSTVTAALRALADRDLINYEPYGLITLTATGRKAARDLVIRNLIVRSFIEDVLGLEPAQAQQTTCDMEHAINRQALERFVCFLAFFRRRLPAGVDWLDAFRRFMKEGADGRTCEECMKDYVGELELDKEHESSQTPTNAQIPGKPKKIT